MSEEDKRGFIDYDIALVRVMNVYFLNEECSSQASKLRRTAITLVWAEVTGQTYFDALAEIKFAG